jgi:tRNA(Ile)-lysidine synthase
MDESIKFIRENIPNRSALVVGVSGGPDSMCLLNLLLELKEEKRFSIVVAHINHNLREESDEEYEFVKKFSEDHNLLFEGIKLGEYNTNSIENEARTKRYNFYEEVLKKYKSKYLLLAHHGDDLVETILMRLTRGSTIDGYSGFNKISKRDNYSIYRPLIFYTKDDIMEYLEEKHIDYRIDKSNFNKKFTRNRYRLDILPVLKKENKNIHKKYLSFSEELEESNNFIDKYVSSRYIDIVKDNIIDLNLLLKEDRYIVKRVINKYLFNNYKSNINLIESKHVQSILDLIESNKPNTFITLPNNIMLEKSYDKLYIKDTDKLNNYKIAIKDKVVINEFIIEKIKETDFTNNFVCHLNSKDISLPLYVRNRKDGDYIEILNLNGKKKIKDLFIDSKIDKTLRDNYPLVVDSNDDILWVPGLKKSKYDSLKKGKYDIILKCTRRKIDE